MRNAIIATVALCFAMILPGQASAEVTCNRFGCSDWRVVGQSDHFRDATKKVRRGAKRAVSRGTNDANGNRAFLTTIRASNGKSAKVASRYARQFQGFIDDLERAGYRIDFIGGWRRHGSCRACDAHPAGRAIDVNQTGRNRVTRSLPPRVTDIAARHGLCHGAIWNSPDRGHFEVAAKSRATSCHRFAREHWPRLVERTSAP